MSSFLFVERMQPLWLLQGPGLLQEGFPWDVLGCLAGWAAPTGHHQAGHGLSCKLTGAQHFHESQGKTRSEGGVQCPSFCPLIVSVPLCQGLWPAAHSEVNLLLESSRVNVLVLFAV